MTSFTTKHANTQNKIKRVRKPAKAKKYSVPERNISTRYHLEIIRSSDGGIEGTDTFNGTEQAALALAKHWLAEAHTLDSYQKEILVINTETDECIYQGNFEE